MGKLIVPQHIARERQHNAQMATPIVFWYSKKLGHIMVPPHWTVPAPAGYERIECRHANEVDMWSKRLDAQDKRILEMDMEQRYYFEDPIRKNMMDELRKNLADARDPVNRAFLERAIEKIGEKRKHTYDAMVESKMHCETKEGVAS